MKKHLSLTACLFACLVSCLTFAQDTVTGAFEGTVTDSQTGAPLAGAAAAIINQETGLTIRKLTDARGRFYQGLLPPGVYLIRVSLSGYQTREVQQRLKIAVTGEVVPVPVTLDPATVAVAPPPPSLAATDVRASLNRSDASRSQSFSEEQVSALPLGAATSTRSFDQLALLAAGVAPPPQTLGSVAGPGQGAGVGSAGQFAVNGLRSRGNNFTVDGSDNNDEDIGVRRQGFVSLIPQPIESIKEYQIITLLAPAQFGRNLGAQVNAVSKSGGKELHGALYGFFNASQLNARNFFDTTNGNAVTPLRAANGQAVLLNEQPLTVRNGSGGKDSFTFGQFGATLGGPLKRERTFYFLAAEGQVINAAQEEHFAVPTIEERGAFNSGATGVARDPFTGAPTRATPTGRNGAAILSLFPFPNQPTGVYGTNTFTQTLPADARGQVLSAKLDHNFKLAGQQQTATARYNYTNDRRTIPVTGQALFSTLQPRVRAQNFSFFLNGALGATLLNQLRLSYGRTRLAFREVRDREFLLPSVDFPQTPFLLNAPNLRNLTLPPDAGAPNTGPVVFRRAADPPTVEEEFGPLGQVSLAGFSPIGVDVFNFPQQRVNNTYQFADNLTWRRNNHTATFGFDVRRSELNSDLPRAARPLVTFQGGPRLTFENGQFRVPVDNRQVLRPTDLAAVGVPSAFYFTIAQSRTDAAINLRFYQFNFFAQDNWRLHRELTLAYGLRYEYNTPPRERHNRIESTFNDDALNLVPGLRRFLDNRQRIFAPDRNNFAPRLSLAYAPNWFGRQRATVLRGGYGVFHDQFLGAVVSQSRNVFPSFLTLNFSGLFASRGDNVLTFTNPAATVIGDQPLALPGRTIYQLNPALSLNRVVQVLEFAFPSAFGLTLPAHRLATPLAQHYSFAFEQQLRAELLVSAAYVGTLGRSLLRLTTPNLGPSATVAPNRFTAQRDGALFVPELFGRICSPAPDPQRLCQPGRVVNGVGPVNLFETTARSRYDALQLQVRGRFRQKLQYQAQYTLARAADDVSDVFDLAGAFALPQNSLTLAGERGPASFDARHRFAYQLVFEFKGWQFTGIGQLQTGQPFTVNSIFDVNLDGNLTDRLNTTNGLLITNKGRQPLRLATDNTFSLLAPFGQDGRLARNTFRTGARVELDLAVSRTFALAAQRQLLLRAEIFNLLNRANFGAPVRLLEAPGFGQAANTVTPARRIQLSLKYVF